MKKVITLFGVLMVLLLVGWVLSPGDVVTSAPAQTPPEQTADPDGGLSDATFLPGFDGAGRNPEPLPIPPLEEPDEEPPEDEPPGDEPGGDDQPPLDEPEPSPLKK